MRDCIRFSIALAAVSFLVFASGCPSSAPTSPKADTTDVSSGPGEASSGSTEVLVEQSTDDADHVKALEANGAILTKDAERVRTLGSPAT